MRSFQTVEAHEDACVVMGYAATYEPYPLFLAADGVEWRERIAPDAFAGTDLSDVIFQYDHAGRIYARTTNGSLETVPDGRGLRIWADLSLTDGSRALYADIRAGLITKMSFAFVVDRDHIEADGHIRVIDHIRRVYDVSAVSFPANGGTEIGASLRARLRADRTAAGVPGDADRRRRLALRARCGRGGSI